MTKKDLDALQKGLQKHIDDLKKWAQAEDAAKIKDIKDLGDWAKGEINALRDWAAGEFDKLFKALGSK